MSRVFSSDLFHVFCHGTTTAPSACHLAHWRRHRNTDVANVERGSIVQLQQMVQSRLELHIRFLILRQFKYDAAPEVAADCRAPREVRTPAESTSGCLRLQCPHHTHCILMSSDEEHFYWQLAVATEGNKANSRRVICLLMMMTVMMLEVW